MHRRAFWRTLAAATFAGSILGQASAASPRRARRPSARTDILAQDGTNLFYREAGEGAGAPVVFAAPWAMNSTWFDYQIAGLSERGLRCIAYDRRGHGRSPEPATGYDFDTLAADLEAVIEQLDLHAVTLVGQSMGCGEIVRYLARRPSRVARAVLVSTITPMLLKTADNPDGIDEAIFEQGRKQLAMDRVHQVAQAGPDFFGVPHNTVSAEIIDWWTRIIVDQCSLRVMLELQRAFTRADFRADLRKVAVPVLLIHGERDKSTLLDRTARRTAPLLTDCELKIYENAAHGLPITHAERLNADIYAFAKASS
ncbi:MAG TPA: alpha/beta hydrolase [Steroidobacteraceae bacterium]|nr:alpha/beta hydrolase [Steroidobacteraceae bacterium]